MVEYIAPAPAVVLSPSPVVEFVAPAPTLSEAPAPGVESLSHAPVLSEAPAPGGCFSPAPAVFRVGGLQVSVPGQSSTSRRRHDLPLPSGWRRADDASGRVYYWHVHTRQTRWTPPVLVDEEEDEDEDEDEKDEDMDESHGTESRFPAGFRHADVPVVPLRELPAGMGVYVRSLVERAAPPSSWSRAVTAFYGSLYLAVTFLPEECWVMDFSARSLQKCFRMLHSLVRQWIHVWRQSMRLFGRISRSSRGGLWEMTSRLSPYSALSLVRFWIHALRQSAELVKDCACLSVVLVLIRTLCSLLPFTGPDALHHGRYGPEVLFMVVQPVVCNDIRLWFRLHKTVESPQFSFCSSSSLSWRRCRCSWSFTTEFLQLQYIDTMVDVQVVACPLCGPCAQVQGRADPRH